MYSDLLNILTDYNFTDNIDINLDQRLVKFAGDIAQALEFMENMKVCEVLLRTSIVLFCDKSKTFE